MNRFKLQIIAYITMTFDHIGMLFFNYETLWWYVFRMAGRLAFPLFALFTAEGYFHTKNKTKYFLRLLAFGLIIETFFVVANLFVHISKTELNIFLTLSYGLLGIIIIHLPKWYKLLFIPYIALFILLETIVIPLPFMDISLYFEYGLYGILTIVLFGISPKLTYLKRFLVCFGFIILTLIFGYPSLLSMLNYAWVDYIYRMPHEIQYISLLCLPIIFFYNGKRGKKIPKFLTYSYYPLHLLVLWGIYYLFLLV